MNTERVPFKIRSGRREEALTAFQAGTAPGSVSLLTSAATANGISIRGGSRIPGFRAVALARMPASLTWLWLALPVAVSAQTTNDIPPLRPAYPELPPTFWEQHGMWIVVLAAIFTVLVVLAVWWWLRPKPPVVIPIETQTRRELEALLRQREDGRILSQVSRCLRRYVAVAFHLPTDELTTAEFCKAMTGQNKIDPELASALCEFLRRCDELKFAPTEPSPSFGAAERALQLIQQCEARRPQP